MKLIFIILFLFLEYLNENYYKKKFFNENFIIDEKDFFKYEIINIGQGLFSYFTSKKNPYTIFIYDAGTINSKWVKNFKQSINNLKLNIFCKEGLKIKIFISHPHTDHFNIIKKIFQKRCVNKIHSIVFIINSIYYENLNYYKSFNMIGFKFKDILDYKNNKLEIKNPKVEKYLKKLGLFKVDDFKKDNYEIKFGIAKFKLLFDINIFENFNLKDKNDSSLIIKFYVGKIDNGILLTGDATFYTYNNLFNFSKYYLKSKIYLVSHHGSNTKGSNNVEFLKKVLDKNSIAVISSPPFPNLLWKNEKGRNRSLGGYYHPFGLLITNLYFLFKSTCITGNEGDLEFIITKENIFNRNECKKINFECKIFKNKFCYWRKKYKRIIKWSH